MSDSHFYKNEKLYRAVLPMESFIKEDGSISRGAFTDSNKDSGLSVDRQKYRDNIEAVEYIASMKKGYIVSIKVSDCDEKNIEYTFCPLDDNPYHSEVSKDRKNKKFTLTKGQAKHLARVCEIELEREEKY